jgi:prepilin-type N-terminal cleavage/methylation domain-containing protein
MSKTIRTIKKSGFTLIELLIVIGLLAALASVILPTLMGDRDTALNSVDKYNQAGTLRTLRQYEAMTGELPNGLHTGLQAADGTDGVMPGVSATLQANVTTMGSVVALSPDDVTALRKIGIQQLACGTGNPDAHTLATTLGYQNVSTTLYTLSLPMGEDSLWKDKNGKTLSFNGKGLHYLGHASYTKVIPLFIAPTAQWNAEGKNWVKGFSVSMDIPATSPLPESGEFPYYIAYIGIQGGGYEILCAKSGDDAEDAPDIHFHSRAATTTQVLGMIQEEINEYEGSGSFGAVTTGGGDTWTVTFTPTTGDTTLYSFSLEHDPDSKAELLGTSNPDCVVTNP